MISAAAHSTPRAKLALARASSSAAAQQTRQYRYGPWQVETDNDARGRTVRYQYMETLSGKLAWDSKCARLAAKPSSPSFSHAISSSTAWYVDAASIKSWSDHLSSISSGPIRGQPVDQLLRSQQDTPQNVENLRLPLKAVRDYIQEFAPKGSTETVDAEKVIQATSEFPAYRDLAGYKSSSFDDPNTPWELTAEEKSKHYDDLQKYRPIEWNEPNGLPSDSAQKYDDLDKYGPVTWNEPDGLPGKTAEEKTKSYSDLDKYGPSSYSEPDGLRPLTSEELSKNYDDLDKYSEGFKCRDTLLKEQQAREMDGTPRGTPRPARVDAPATNYAAEYNDLDKYGPVKWNEPDGLPNATPEELTKNYDDLHRYAQYDNDGPKADRIHPEQASKNYGDLNRYDAFPNADLAARVHPEEATKNYKDLDSYTPIMDETPVNAHNSLHQEFNEHDMEIRLKTASHQAGVEELGIADTATGATNGAIKAAARRRFINLEDAKKEYQTSFEADVPKGRVSNAQPVVDVELEAMRRAENLYDGKAKYATEWGAQQYQQPPVAEQLESVAEQRLSTLEDAKVEYESSWESTTDRRVEERDDGVSSMDESFPIHDALSQPSTEQRKSRFTAAEQDPFSKNPQGLEVSYSQEVGGRSTWPTLVRHYRQDANEDADQVSPPQAVSGGRGPVNAGAGTPAEYIVLAFDPETQAVNVAETSSGVENLSSSLTPAEAILRLAHPAKFFPHFKPLQMQGYEIVSGRGDVLIFRKVREAIAGAPAYDPSIVGRRKKSLARRLTVGAAAAAGAAYGAGTLAEYMSTNGLL